jgi:PilZ domain
MKGITQRKAERLYRPVSVKLTIGGRTFAVHNISVGGVGFMSDGPLPFKFNERLPVTVELEGRLVEMEGHVMHLSPVSELRSNLALEKECYLCGISFETCETGAREAIASFVDSRLPRETAR